MIHHSIFGWYLTYGDHFSWLSTTGAWHGAIQGAIYGAGIGLARIVYVWWRGDL